MHTQEESLGALALTHGATSTRTPTIALSSFLSFEYEALLSLINLFPQRPCASIEVVVYFVHYVSHDFLDVDIIFG